jgi:hypothetical protein
MTKDLSSLITEAEKERDIVDRPEAVALRDAIFKAVDSYVEYLDQRGLVWDWDNPDDPRLKAQALIVEMKLDGPDGYTTDIYLKGGAFDRFYGAGVDCGDHDSPETKHH